MSNFHFTGVKTCENRLENRIVSGGEDKCILWDLSPKKELPTDIKGNVLSNKKNVLKLKTI